METPRPIKVRRPDNLQDPKFLAFKNRYPLASYPEFLVFWWLEDHGYHEFDDFWYQVDFIGGRGARGGLVADFLLEFTNPRTILEVYGVVFHTAPVRRGPQTLADDIIRKAFYEAKGFRFIRCRDTDLVNRLDYVMRAAVNGIEIGVFT